MVRINLIDPKALADQHLVAEYNEMLMLVGYVHKYPDLSGIPHRYTLGTGHIRFFKDKLGYIQKRFARVKREMVSRGFRPTKELDLSGFGSCHTRQWTPRKEDYHIIRRRLADRLRMKPGFYRYCGIRRSTDFSLRLLRSANTRY
jgi:deoxyribonuclease (pyrimidine dimer)